MTLDLVFVGADAGRRTLAQLAAEVGIATRLVAQRATHMEVFSVSVLTVELDGEAPALDAARSWIAARGIHRLRG